MEREDEQTNELEWIGKHRGRFQGTVPAGNDEAQAREFTNTAVGTRGTHAEVSAKYFRTTTCELWGRNRLYNIAIKHHKT
jgi:hypothetical protein